MYGSRVELNQNIKMENIQDLKNMEFTSIKALVELIDSNFGIEKVKKVSTMNMDDFLNPTQNYILITEDENIDFNIKVDFWKRKGGFNLIVEEIEKYDLQDEGFLKSKSVDIFNMDEFKVFFLLKESKRNSKKTIKTFISELVEELKPFSIEE